MTVREQLLQQALSLTPADRALLADQLEASLPQSSALTADFAEDWSAEIDRRLAAYDRGESVARDIDDVIRRIREALAARRSSP